MNKFIFGLIIGLSLIATSAWALPIVQSKLGGTGTSTVPTLGQILVGQSNGSYGPQATSTLGIVSFSSTSADTWFSSKTTANLTENTNLYYTDARVNSYISASTTIPKTYATNTFTTTNTFPTLIATTVGIGTTTPAYDLDVYGTTSTRTLIVDDGGTTGTTTVAIGNPKIGKICQWNGTNWTMTYFADNSITPIYATSTSCQ